MNSNSRRRRRNSSSSCRRQMIQLAGSSSSSSSVHTTFLRLRINAAVAMLVMLVASTTTTTMTTTTTLFTMAQAQTYPPTISNVPTISHFPSRPTNAPSFLGTEVGTTLQPSSPPMAILTMAPATDAPSTGAPSAMEVVTVSRVVMFVTHLFYCGWGMSRVNERGLVS